MKNLVKLIAVLLFLLSPASAQSVIVDAMPATEMASKIIPIPCELCPPFPRPDPPISPFHISPFYGQERSFSAISIH